MIKLEVKILPNERVDDLQFKGYKIIQNPDAFCFGTDAVLLADFADIRKNDKVADLGSGTGIIPILLAAHTDASFITGIEIQQSMAEMSDRSVKLNNLENKVKIICGDLKGAADFIEKGSLDAVTANPPYRKCGSGAVNDKSVYMIARHEILCTLDDVIRISSDLLRFGGRISIVHQPERMMDILYLMRQFGIEPKRIRIVYPDVNHNPNIILIEGIKGGKPFLKWMPPLIMSSDGRYTDEMDRIYHRGKYYE